MIAIGQDLAGQARLLMLRNSLMDLGHKLELQDAKLHHKNYRQDLSQKSGDYSQLDFNDKDNDYPTSCEP